jgi:hypothetical protein
MECDTPPLVAVRVIV